MGLYRTAAPAGSTTGGTWYARFCNTNSYGARQLTYGRVVSPCRDCPAGLVTSQDAAAFPNSAAFFAAADAAALGANATADSSGGSAGAQGGFTDPRACVNQAGWGYNGRSASPCPPGTHSNRDSPATRCVACPPGTTTAGPGAGVTTHDCRVAPGFGVVAGAGGSSGGSGSSGVSNGTIAPCPVGESSPICCAAVTVSPG
jgi:hypothetical protein